MDRARPEGLPDTANRVIAVPVGQRFLIGEITKPPSPITILLNWRPR